MRYGFIGLGRLGRHLARSLTRAGFELTVHDLDKDAAAPLFEEGARWAPSPRAAAESADAVITCLPSPAAATAVVAGDEGVLEGLKAGGAWIEMGTNHPDEVRRIAALASARGVRCLEAPVTGGVHKAASGRITVLVGGEKATFEAHLPAFRAMGEPVLYLGPLGSASTIKVITNMLAFIHLVGAGEALMLVKRAGLDLGAAFEAIRASSGNSFVHETESQVILNGSYDIGFTIDLALKDLALAHDLGRAAGVPLTLARLVQSRFEEAKDRYGGSAWSPMVVKLLEDALRNDLRAEGFPASLEP